MIWRFFSKREFTFFSVFFFWKKKKGKLEIRRNVLNWDDEDGRKKGRREEKKERKKRREKKRKGCLIQMMRY